MEKGFSSEDVGPINRTYKKLCSRNELYLFCSTFGIKCQYKCKNLPKTVISSKNLQSKSAKQREKINPLLRLGCTNVTL